MLSNIILLAQVEELPNLVGALGAKATGLGAVGHIRDVLITLLDDDQVEHREVGRNDAAADRLSLALTSAASAVAGKALGQEEAGAAVGEDALLHGESLFVIASGDSEDLNKNTTQTF